MNKRADKSGLDFDAEVNGVKADLSKVNDPQTKEAISQLDLQQLSGKIAMKGRVGRLLRARSTSPNIP